MRSVNANLFEINQAKARINKHISSHGCAYSRTGISTILYMAVDCMRELLLEGKKIRLGDLGDFSVSLASKGADSADKFSAQNITGVNVVWDCGQEFKNLINDAEFNLVASRSAQAAVLKAIKAGESVVDLNATSSDNPNGGNDGGGTTPGDDLQTGGSTNTGGNQTGGTSGSQTPSGGGTTPPSGDDEMGD